MVDLYLIRHGPTHLKSMVGWTDVPADLTDKLKLLRLKNLLPETDLIISSDLKRASATADALKLNTPRLPNDPDLREINFGDWEGKNFSEINSKNQKTVFSFFDNPGRVSAPGGESWNDLKRRVCRAVNTLKKSHDNNKIVVVTHFGVIISLIQVVGRMNAREALSHKIENLSLTHITYGENFSKIHNINAQA